MNEKILIKEMISNKEREIMFGTAKKIGTEDLNNTLVIEDDIEEEIGKLDDEQKYSVKVLNKYRELTENEPAWS